MKKLFADLSMTTYRIFAVVFACSFGFILFNIIFNKSVYNYMSILMVFSIVIVLGCFITLSDFARKNQREIQNKYPYILGLSAVLLFFIQIIMIPILRYVPQYDLEAIYSGAIEWVEKGTFTQYQSNTCYDDYFYIFPNNLGGLAFLTVIFKAASVVGITDYFFVASTVNSILICGTMVLSSLICKRLFGIAAAVIAISMFMLSPPFYFMAPVFYTDSLSLIFPVAMFYLILCATDSKNKLVKALLFLSTSVICAIGTLIKATVLITVIAVCIYFILKKSFKLLMIYLLVSALGLAICIGSFNSYIYSSHLDPIKAEQVNTPIYYWLDLGFHGNGQYNNDIFLLSLNTKDAQLRNELLKTDILEQINDLGVKGVYNLFERKSTRAFGDGTYVLSDFLDDSPVKHTLLHKFVLYNGKHYSIYSFIATAIFLSLLALMICSIKFKKPNLVAAVPQIAVFGIMFFLLFLENNSRYITTYIPFIIICSASGACAICEKRINKAEKRLDP